jgi:site-specific recombinase XerD
MAEADFTRSAKAPATERSYRSDLAIFVAWCDGRKLSSLPADPATVAAFIRHQAKRLKASTIGRRLAAIGYMHRLADQPNPTHHSDVMVAKEEIFRRIGVAKTKKSPAISDLVVAMALSCDGSLRGLRDRAILLLGFAGGFPRSELVALDVVDIQEVPEGLRVRVRRGQTDQHARGFTKAILPQARACPVAALRAWLDAAGISRGPIFRRIRGRRAVTADRLKDAAVAQIVKAGAARLGLDVSTFSGHSLRSGLCTSALQRGANIKKLMDLTGHRSFDALLECVQDADLFRNHAAEGLL